MTNSNIREKIIKILKDNESIFEYEDAVADQILQLIIQSLPEEKDYSNEEYELEWIDGWNAFGSEIIKLLKGE